MLRTSILALLLVAGAAGAQPTRRIAVIAGNDRGGEGTRPLLYAVEDARKIHDVLTRLGNVRGEDALLVLDQDAPLLLAAVGEAERRAAEARARGERTELLIYYSGHAKDGALRMNASQLAFETLRARLAQAPADVRIGIFDSCRSGALTRSKGARKAPEFEIQTDAGRVAKGLVILTSSTSDEDSQESDALGGSYFTHHLTSALLGDADRSSDGAVTLEEAYGYAYDRTVADTSGSSAGAQHPTFSYDLAGNGDLVLTHVTSRSEGLAFPASAPAGVYYLVDAKGFVAAEVWKDRDVERRIAVPPGSYRIRRRLDDRLRIGEVTVAGGQVTTVDEARFRDAPFTDDPVKGHVAPPPRTTYALSLGYQSFTDARTRELLFPATSLLAFEAINERFVLPSLRLGWDVAVGGSRATLELPTLRLPYRFTEANVGGSLLWEPMAGRFSPFLGVRVAGVVMTRQFDSGNVRFQSLFTVVPGVVFGARLSLGERWGLMARGRLNYFLYNIDGVRHLSYWEAGAMVTYAM